MILSIAGAAVAGGAAGAVQLLRAGKKRVRLILGTLVVSWLALLILHSRFVFAGPIREGKRLGSVVVSWSRAGCEGSVDCGAQETRDCLKDLAWDQGLIDQCWGEGRVVAVRIALILCALLASGGFGASVAAWVVAWRSGKGREPGPLRFFICYRRADSLEVAKLLHDRLSDRFGAGNVTLDVEDTPLGEDFRQAHRGELERSDVLLLVIGPRWLEIQDDGTRRLDHPDDRVRIEIEIADEASLWIVPVLVGAPMPKADQMPDRFRYLSKLNGFPIEGKPSAPDDPALNSSVKKLIKKLEAGRKGERDW
jgi:hypothetical protein